MNSAGGLALPIHLEPETCFVAFVPRLSLFPSLEQPQPLLVSHTWPFILVKSKQEGLSLFLVCFPM